MNKKVLWVTLGLFFLVAAALILLGFDMPRSAEAPEDMIPENIVAEGDTDTVEFNEEAYIAGGEATPDAPDEPIVIPQN